MYYFIKVSIFDLWFLNNCPFKGVHHIGSGTVTLHKYGEDYVVTFPSAYGRSIMSTPWIELGGKVLMIFWFKIN
jgi:hypothetical protein